MNSRTSTHLLGPFLLQPVTLKRPGGLVERQLLAPIEAFGGDLDIRASGAQSCNEAEVPVIASGVDLEGVVAEPADALPKVGQHELTPPASNLGRNVGQRVIVRLQHPLGFDQPMLGRQDEPSITTAFDIPAPAAE